MRRPLTRGPELYIIEALLILASTAYLYRIDTKASRAGEERSDGRPSQLGRERGVIELELQSAESEHGGRAGAWIGEFDTLRMQAGTASSDL